MDNLQLLMHHASKDTTGIYADIGPAFNEEKYREIMGGTILTEEQKQVLIAMKFQKFNAAIKEIVREG